MTIRHHDLIEIAGDVEGETKLAYRFFDGDRHVWLPKSQCEWDPIAHIMTMPEWLAVEKELV